MPENSYAGKETELQTPITQDADQSLSVRSKKLLTHLLPKVLPKAVSSLIAWVFGIINKAWRRFQLEVSQLTFPQWCYFIAILIFFYAVEGDLAESPNTVWVGLIAGMGLMRELWSLFHRFWQKTLGKGVLLVLYAATANFALAISALKINDISGIEPAPFIFTLGFTTLTMLPFWLIMASVLFFAIAIIVQTIWLIVGLLLRIVRVKIRMHWEHEGFAVLTILLRLILTPIVITALTQFARPYTEQINFMELPPGLFDMSDTANQPSANVSNRPVIQLFGESSDTVQDIIEQAKAEQRNRENRQNSALSEDGISNPDTLMSEVEKQRDLDRLISALPYFESLSAINVPFNFSVADIGSAASLGQDSQSNIDSGAESAVAQNPEVTSDNGAEQETNEESSNERSELADVEQSEKNRDLDRLIAAFIYYFETYPNSMCKKKPSQHSLVIDENSVLLVEKTDNELGYAFTVEECVHVYQKE